MNPIKNYRRKLIKLEKKAVKLERDKNVLANILNEAKAKQNARLNYLLDGIDLQEEISYLDDWEKFYKERIERCRSRIRLQEDEAHEAWRSLDSAGEAKQNIRGIAIKRLAKYAIPLAILLLVISLFLLKPSLTGYVTFAKETTYNKSLGLRINESSNYTWQLDRLGQLKSVKATGSFSGNGSIKVYIEKDGKRYLIFDNQRLNKD